MGNTHPAELHMALGMAALWGTSVFAHPAELT